MIRKLPRGWHRWWMKPVRFLVDFFVPYTWAYQWGFSAGMKKSGYFRGMADGQEQTHEFYQNNAIFELKKKHTK